MITYRSLSRTPRAFKSLSGLSVAEFDALCREWMHADSVARAEAALTRSDAHPRQRAPGAGRKWVLDAPTRLLAALVWLKLYPSWAVLGYLFGVEESATRRSTHDVLERLEGLATFPLERRPPRRAAGRSLAEIFEQEPCVEILVDSHEQKTRRPKGWDAQKPFYSGKKKTHTLKTQAAVDLSGRVQAVSESVPGSVHDLTLLETSALAAQLAPTEALCGDKAYLGAEQRLGGVDVYTPVKKPRGGELTPEQTSYNRLLASVRIAVEHLFARISHFGALAQVWRHRRAGHSRVFRVAAWLADRQIAAARAQATCA
jgi:hypothetical protein